MTERILDRLRDGLVRTAKRSAEILCLSAILTSSTVELSPESDDPKKASDAERIDWELMAYLTNRKMINWCDKTCKLAPLRNIQTRGSGLLRAVASSIWGQQDDETDSFLQRLLHVALTSGGQKTTLKERWELEQEKWNSSTDEGHSKNAWEDVSHAFRGDELRMEKEEDLHLDPIHIFSLSNILRRPVIVLGDVSSAFNQPSVTDLTGIYLPLLSSAESCVPYPLLVVRHEGVFRALLVHRVPLEWWQMQVFRSVPLVRVDQEPFHARCLLTSETRRVRDLLLSYLKLAEISCTTTDGVFPVLTSRLSAEKPPLGSPKREEVFVKAAHAQMTPFSESSLVTDEAPNEDEDEEEHLQTDAASRERDSGCVRNCIACQAIRRAELTKLSGGISTADAGVLSAPSTVSTRCATVRCKNKGSPKYGGRCYACYVTKEEDQSLEDQSDEDEELGRLKVTNLEEEEEEEEDAVRLRLEAMGELVVEELRNSRKAQSRTDARTDKDKVIAAKVKDTKKSIRVEDRDERAKVKGSDNVNPTQKFENAKDKREPARAKDKMDDAERATDSRKDKAVREVPKVNDLSKVNKFRDADAVTRTADPVEFVTVSDTREPTKDPAVPSVLHDTRCTDAFVPTSVSRRPTNEQVMAFDSRLTSKRRRNTDEKCIVDFCTNAAEKVHRGLCRPCYQTLALHRTSRDREEETVLPVPSTAVAGVRCLMEGCKELVTNKQLGLCLPCLRMQIFAARDLERRKELRHSLRKPSENPSHKAEAEIIGSSDERWPGCHKRRISKSPSDVRAAQDAYPPPPPSPSPPPQHSRTSLLNYSSQRTDAKCCPSPDCDRYGDPSFDGFCSLCFERHTSGQLVPRN